MSSKNLPVIQAFAVWFRHELMSVLHQCKNTETSILAIIAVFVLFCSVFMELLLDQVLTGCVPGAGGAVLPV